MDVGPDPEVWGPANDVAEQDVYLRQDGGRVCFCLRLDDPDNVAEDAVVGSIPEWLRPGSAVGAAHAATASIVCFRRCRCSSRRR